MAEGVNDTNSDGKTVMIFSNRFTPLSAKVADRQRRDMENRLRVDKKTS